MKLKISLFFIFAIALASCVDIPDFDNKPKIEYNGVTHYKGEDSLGNSVEYVTLSIYFEDGDGDLGNPNEDVADTIKYPKNSWGNYELVTCMFINNQWQERILEVNQRQFFPVLKKDGKAGPIKGNLDLNTLAPYFPGAPMVLHKWKIKIRDRSFNVSNQIMETDSVLLPLLPGSV
jgi:hypothetical protein